MYCVIQEVTRKKPNQYGEYRELAAEQDGWTISGKPPAWSFRRAGGRFERPHQEAYKITLCESYRKGGKPRKRQYPICTMGWYDIAEYCLYDFADSAIKALTGQLGIEYDKIYDLIESKLAPLREKITTEFQQSEEYQAAQKHRQVVEAYQAAKDAFCKQYGVDGSEYDRCFDVFGVLRNSTYLKQLQAEYKARQKAQREARSRARKEWQERAKQYASGGYSAAPASTYTADETAMLKEFYKALSKKYHPDKNPGQDTTKQMQLLNRLKQAWGV